jgi:hypothetical protein
MWLSPNYENAAARRGPAYEFPISMHLTIGFCRSRRNAPLVRTGQRIEHAGSLKTKSGGNAW